jgi:hypothetical protein
MPIEIIKGHIGSSNVLLVGFGDQDHVQEVHQRHPMLTEDHLRTARVRTVQRHYCGFV